MVTSSHATVGDYELERQIGAGASGTVWRAHSRGPVARVVAIKRLPVGGGAGELERLRREATVLTDLDHPHIVRVLEVLHDGDGIALAMQFAPGGSLDELLAERGRLTPGQVVAVAAPVADALASAHRRGIVHGDVKPANVLFTSDGEPLLSDFGVARTLGGFTSDQVSGTAEYVAPELLDGARPDPRADVYSLGVVCYQALAGQPPYAGPVPLAVVRAADTGQHLRLESLTHV
ncbi:MAG: serine/threonine-protein kinase, partial [Acidimicrobiales bacterium]